MSRTIKTTVIVPALNEEAALGDCLASLVASDYPRELLEIICIDNGSTDQTATIAASFQPQVRLLREPRRGISLARNCGIEAATGSVIAFTDADCTVEPSWLGELVATLARRPTAGIAGGRILARRPCNRIERFGESLHDHRAALSPHGQAPYAITMNWASPKGVFDAVGRFNVDLPRGEDVDLAYRIVQAGFELSYVDSAIVYHRNRDTVMGLMHEAYLHGSCGPAVRRRHREFLSSYPGTSPATKRLRIALREVVQTRFASDAMLRFIFTAAKIAGETHANLRTSP